MIISAETDSSWVMKFQQYKNNFHQFVLVPVYRCGNIIQLQGKHCTVPSSCQIIFEFLAGNQLNDWSCHSTVHSGLRGGVTWT